ncbi:OmpA family protein [Sphingomonas japonica]|uniref:Outer membrane protein OmpA-like peptidoglycan-associated protein n=1 Tax=Sphingomonas japonica TaxID=511662 RepID=A0ABX0U1J3_9SPHN|nr:OmpA family protein [Sphingomonas japonica]NIJ24434.1 outer membrane protein OmpA-like peptidoglycan-associated protein [Sphingomonas japonica]
MRSAGGVQSGLAAGNGSGQTQLSQVQSLQSDLGATQTDRGTLVSLPGDVTFDFDKATIQPDARGTLDKLAALIAAQNPPSVSVEGHTDAKGDDAYNQRLSEARAEAVLDYLAAQRGVDRARLKSIGLGELRPIAPNAGPTGGDDAEGRQKNRRVEVILGR